MKILLEVELVEHEDRRWYEVRGRYSDRDDIYSLRWPGHGDLDGERERIVPEGWTGIELTAIEATIEQVAHAMLPRLLVGTPKRGG